MTARGDELPTCARVACASGFASAGRHGPSRALARSAAQGVIPSPGYAGTSPLLQFQRRASYAQGSSIGGGTRRERRCPPRCRIHCKGSAIHLGDRARHANGSANGASDSTLSHVSDGNCVGANRLLPHLNPGVMSWSEMSWLKPVAPSRHDAETTSRRETAGLAHGSPDKDPVVHSVS